MNKIYSKEEILQVLKDIDSINTIDGKITIKCFGMNGEIGIPNFLEGSFTRELLQLISKHMDLK